MAPYDPATEGETGRRPAAAELFAGVGGFHLALDRAGFDVVWSNQWEPATKVLLNPGKPLKAEHQTEATTA